MLDWAKPTQHSYGGHSTSAAGTSPEAAAAADFPARVRQSGAAVCRRERGLSALPVAFDRTRAAGPRASGHRTPHSSSTFSGGQEPGHLRVSRHSGGQPGAGTGAGALRVSAAPRERAAAGQLRSCDILLHLTNALKLGAVALLHFELVEHAPD